MDREGAPFDRLGKVSALETAGDEQSWSVRVVAPQGRPVTGRVCAIRKTEEAIRIAQEGIRTEARRKGRQVKPQTLEFTRFVIMFTTFPAATYSIRMEFALIPGGTFAMSSISSEAFGDEQQVMQVRISAAFWMGRHEVTQGQWEAVMGSNSSSFADCGPDCPVEGFSWLDVQDFITRLNEREGGSRYRLPTEAEWEYAARAGTSGDRYSENLDAIAWYGDTSGGHTQPVGRKAPNAWGLHDMLGNVEESVQDWYGAYPEGSVTDPPGPGTGSRRVDRGGAYHFTATACRTPA